MSVARASHLEPLQEFDLPVNKTALVVGGGVAGMTCALSIAAQGHEVQLVEQAKDLGGIARRLHKTIEGMDVQAYLKDMISAVYRNPMILGKNDLLLGVCAAYARAVAVFTGRHLSGTYALNPCYFLGVFLIGGA